MKITAANKIHDMDPAPCPRRISAPTPPILATAPVVRIILSTVPKPTPRLSPGRSIQGRPRPAGDARKASDGVSADKIFSFQRDLIRFRLIKHSGDPQMMRAKLEGDKLPIPEKIIKKAGLKDGDEVEVGLEDGKVVIKPLASLAKFKRELRGCVESSKIDPLEAKRIWKARDGISDAHRGDLTLIDDDRTSPPPFSSLRTEATCSSRSPPSPPSSWSSGGRRTRSRSYILLPVFGGLP